jgi:GNAT superfamily N-acetyltransferase
MAITVRRATRVDATAIARFAVSLFDLHTEWDPRRFTGIATREGATSFYGDRTEAENAAVLVAEEGERIIGFAYLEYEPVLYAELATRVAWLHDIYVEAHYRGKGVGNALITAVKDEAIRLGANKILLSTALGNKEGQRLFERNGFRTTMLEMMLEIDDHNARK